MSENTEETKIQNRGVTQRENKVREFCHAILAFFPTSSFGIISV